MLRGNAPATIDEKGRLKIPSIFRSEIDEAWGGDFYITSVTGESVRVYPFAVWQEIEDRLSRLPSLNPTKKKFLDRTNYYGQVALMDKQGRVLIPPHLRESAKMLGEVAVLGYLNYLDVWNNREFLERLKREPFTEEDEKVMAELGV